MPDTTPGREKIRNGKERGEKRKETRTGKVILNGNKMRRRVTKSKVRASNRRSAF